MDEADELVLPEPPEWAHDEIAKKKNKVVQRHTAPLPTRTRVEIDPDGNALYAI
jgi:hypothetical protein